MKNPSSSMNATHTKQRIFEVVVNESPYPVSRSSLHRQYENSVYHARELLFNFLARHQPLGDSGKTVGPLVPLGLSEEPHCWIPGTVVSIEQPAPIGDRGQRDPHRQAKRA